jgi:NitT/TauT family transport system substrate-binding protein
MNLQLHPRTWLAACGIAAMLALSSTSVRAQPALQKITIALAGDGLHYTALHVADSAGFFKQEGLQVEWINIASGSQMAAALLGGSAQLAGLGFSEVVNSAANGGQLVAISTLYNIYAMNLVLSNSAVKKAGITPKMSLDERLHHLKGLSIGISAPGSSTDAFIRTTLLKRGINPDQEVVLRPLGNGAALFAAFENNIIDGFVWTAPLPQIVTLRKQGEVIASPFTGEISELDNVPYSVLATSRDTLQNKRPLLDAAMRAYTRAIKLIHDQPDVARRLTRPFFSDVEEPAYDLAFRQYLPGIATSPVVTPDELKRTLDWTRLSGKTVDVKYDAVVYPDVARAAAAAILGSPDATTATARTRK